MFTHPKVPASHCSSCRAPIGPIHVNLHRNAECLARPYTTGNHLEVAKARVLKSYCMTCGVEAAREELQQAGFFVQDVHDYENVRICTSCGYSHVNMYEWHPTYLIAVNHFDGNFLDTFEETVVVIPCERCEEVHGYWFRPA